MSEKEKEITKALDALGIRYKMHRHKAVHTFDEASKECTGIKAMQTKNLFLKNAKRTAYYLLVIEGTKKADLKRTARILGEQKLSFAGEEELLHFLNVTPGSVSPLGLLFDAALGVRLLVDADVLAAPEVAFHPNENTASLVLSTEDFRRFLAATGHEPLSLVL